MAKAKTPNLNNGFDTSKQNKAVNLAWQIVTSGNIVGLDCRVNIDPDKING
jgi:hypothetical protein